MKKEEGKKKFENYRNYFKQENFSLGLFFCFVFVCFTSVGSSVVEFRCYTVTDLDGEDGSMSFCLNLH